MPGIRGWSYSELPMSRIECYIRLKHSNINWELGRGKVADFFQDTPPKMAPKSQKLPIFSYFRSKFNIFRLT